MPTSSPVADTPCYVLMAANRPIGPNVMPLRSKTKCTAIYGFSNKDRYDTFCANSQWPLTPYPLVNGYLRNQVERADDVLKLVVIDAAGPREPCLQAVTIEALLDGQKSHVNLAYQLIFDPGTNAYRLDQAPA